MVDAEFHPTACRYLLVPLSPPQCWSQKHQCRTLPAEMIIPFEHVIFDGLVQQQHRPDITVNYLSVQQQN